MVLLDQVVQVLRRSDLGVRVQQAVRLHLAHGEVRDRIVITTPREAEAGLP